MSSVPKPERKLTAEEIAAQQGIKPMTEADLDELYGMGHDCVDSEEDFERWMQELAAIRAEGR
jgi:hypothetical protein